MCLHLPHAVQSQGMTIPLLEVSFNNIFEFGQGYVALSRATCLEGLTLRSFSVSGCGGSGGSGGSSLVVSGDLWMLIGTKLDRRNSLVLSGTPV